MIRFISKVKLKNHYSDCAACTNIRSWKMEIKVYGWCNRESHAEIVWLIIFVLNCGNEQLLNEITNMCPSNDKQLTNVIGPRAAEYFVDVNEIRF